MMGEVVLYIYSTPRSWGMEVVNEVVCKDLGEIKVVVSELRAGQTSIFGPPPMCVNGSDIVLLVWKKLLHALTLVQLQLF